MKKRIVLSVLPIFALVACSDPDVQSVDRYTAPNPESNVVTNSDGSYSQPQETQIDQAAIENGERQLEQSYADARSQGFKGTYEEWVEISELQQTNPEAAQSRAEENGFTGGEMLFAALAGMAIGGLAAKAFNGKDNTSRSYSQQRVNNATNYASVQKYDDRQRRENSGGTGTAFVGGSGAAGAASAQQRSNVSLSKKSNSSNSSYSSRPSSGGSSYAARSSSSYGSVARGGFGGSSSGHGG